MSIEMVLNEETLSEIDKYLLISKFNSLSKLSFNDLDKIR